MSDNFTNAQICSEKLAAGESAANVPECEQAAIGYVQTAKTCVDKGLDSSECQQELLTETAKSAAIYYGVDPSVVDAAEQCISSGGDSEVCAKAGAKLAATAACTVATEGAGGPICAKLAPFVVDAVWPVIGPPLVTIWETAWSFNSGVLGGIADFAKNLLDAVGLDLSTNADPTVTDVFWDLLAMGKGLILPQWQAAVVALQSANDDSRRELGLPMMIPVDAMGKLSLGSVGQMGGPSMDQAIDIAKSDPSEIVSEEAKTHPDAVKELEKWLRADPGWVDPVYVVIRQQDPWGKDYDFEIGFEPTKNEDMGPYDKRVYLGGMDPNMKKLSVGSPQYIPGTYDIEEGEGFAPWNFTYRRFNNERKMLSEAYVAALGVRIEALKSATTNAVGSVIAHNTAEAEANRRAEVISKIRMQEKQGSIALPLALTAAALAAVGAYEWNRRSKS
jgi:hypothetical protein